MSKRILVVEDEPNIVMALEFLMNQQGYEVRSARDGDLALAEVAREPPDVLLLDINLPGRNGFEVCEAVRANPAWKGIRILMLTGKGRDADRRKGLALGADDYLVKPFATQDVIAKVRDLLGESPA